MKLDGFSLKPSRLILVGFFLAFADRAGAAEVSSNGAGGGAWSEPATWRGNAVPKSEDEVTVRKGDVVVFDRDDTGKVTCAKLFIDPQGGLRFKPEAGKIVLVASGPIESFGHIKLDASKSALDLHEIYLTGKAPTDRLIKFEKGGGLIASGKANLAGGKKNVRIVSKAPDPKAVTAIAKIDALAGSSLDLQQAEFDDVVVNATDIDNTGSKPNERLNLGGNRFLNRSTILFVNCDSPVLAENLFEYPGAAVHQPAAVYLNGCPLAEVKNNTFRGLYYFAITVYYSTDAVLANNLADKTYMGFYCAGTCLLRGNTVRGATGGIIVTSFTGTLEDCVFEKCGYGIHVAGATVQITNCSYLDGPKDTGHAIEFTSGEVTMINCNFGPESINLPKPLPKAEKALVVAMNFFVLKVNGEIPEEALVDIRTANLPVVPGTMDLNVRNVPAPLIGNRTPLPQTLSPIILKSWSIDKDGKRIPAPAYTVRVIGPTDGVKERQVFKTLTVTPADIWFRAKPNEPKATVEVILK